MSVRSESEFRVAFTFFFRLVMSPAEQTIVILNDFAYVQGGASKVSIDEAVGLAEAGHRVIFFAPVGPPCVALRAAPLEVICLDQSELQDFKRNPGVAFQGIWNLAAYRRFGQLLDTLDPAQTIIHLHGYTKALTTSPVRAAAKRGFRLVCTLHDFFATCPNGALFNYVTERPCPLTPLSARCVTTSCDKRRYVHKLYRVVRGLAQRHLGRFPSSVHHFITLSVRSAGLLQPFLPSDARLYPLENIIEVEQTPPVPVARNSRIVAIGRLESEKGVALLLEAAAAASMGVTFVGDGPLRSLVEAVPNCEVTGWLSSADVYRALDAARCVVFPSLWYETFGLVVSEAAARGVPAIVSDVTAAAERVTDGETGWVFRSGDAADLRRCLVETRDDTTVANRGTAAYDRYWRKPGTPSRHVQALNDIYRTILMS